jgi:hypothetical protein
VIGAGRRWQVSLRAAWLLWSAVILAVVRPWDGYVGHAHWNRVAWIPFVSWPVSVLDSIANTALFFPWGALQAAAFPGATRRRSLWQVVAVSGLTAATFEFCEVFAHNRVASTTDVVTNVAGALAGAVVGLRAAAASRPRSAGLESGDRDARARRAAQATPALPSRAAPPESP